MNIKLGIGISHDVFRLGYCSHVALPGLKVRRSSGQDAPPTGGGVVPRGSAIPPATCALGGLYLIRVIL